MSQHESRDSGNIITKTADWFNGLPTRGKILIGIGAAALAVLPTTCALNAMTDNSPKPYLTCHGAKTVAAAPGDTITRLIQNNTEFEGIGKPTGRSPELVSRTLAAKPDSTKILTSGNPLEVYSFEGGNGAQNISAGETIIVPAKCTTLG